MSAPLAFVDTETTGLDPDLHEIWEVGLILRDTNGIDGEHTWQLPVDLGRADPIALNIGQFHERREEPMPFVRDFARVFADLTRGAHLVGAVISFDEERLRRLLRANGECPMWHYHLVDVEALAAGYLACRYRGLSPDGPHDDRHALARPPWDSNRLSLAVGVNPEQFDRHTALGDARWARAIYDAVTAGGVS